MNDITVYVKVAAYLGAAFAMGIGTIGPALGQGKIAAEACKSIGKYPESYGQIRTAMVIGLSMVETSAIYAFLTMLILVFRS
jgi:F-type H+-transporting ATPase subunit c